MSTPNERFKWFMERSIRGYIHDMRETPEIYAHAHFVGVLQGLRNTYRQWLMYVGEEPTDYRILLDPEDLTENAKLEICKFYEEESK